jgi:hypothetical protein
MMVCLRERAWLPDPAGTMFHRAGDSRLNAPSNRQGAGRPGRARAAAGHGVIRKNARRQRERNQPGRQRSCTAYIIDRDTGRREYRKSVASDAR